MIAASVYIRMIDFVVGVMAGKSRRNAEEIRAHEPRAPGVRFLLLDEA